MQAGSRARGSIAPERRHLDHVVEGLATRRLVDPQIEERRTWVPGQITPPRPPVSNPTTTRSPPAPAWPFPPKPAHHAPEMVTQCAPSAWGCDVTVPRG